ncbi:hypothetical protein EV702DRAFT_583738 [Suillus placidus]|uniref:Uncharacterized protein n=1 Tax=Suillus placidus TaxID=48579 RepID=A0A9P6ZQ05_9AGAM|nr:hypothetical protein EV702DRAFT_583738 [Suillus placidus]
MASYKLVSQFTEDVFAKEDLICERSACAARILKGDPCFYIATIVIGQRGRFVCAACHRHYQGKAATSMRPTAQRPNPQANAQVIWQNINAAWKPAVAQQPPPRVMATSAGPDIAIPSSWAQPQPGYSVNRRWILLHLSHTDNSQFQNILCEGRKDVDARIDAPGLITLLLDTILPKIRAFAAGFLWRQDQFIVRDGGWVDLSTHPPRQPYFYLECMQATRKGLRAMTFKSKQFVLYVVVPTAQWEEYETWLDKVQEERFSMCSRSEPLFLPSATRSIHSSAHSSTLAGAGAQADSSTIASVEAPSEEEPSTVALSKAPVKWPFHREIASVPSSPPLKKVASANVGFRSPDREQLREVLQSGGTADIDVQQSKYVLLLLVLL